MYFTVPLSAPYLVRKALMCLVFLDFPTLSSYRVNGWSGVGHLQHLSEI